MFSLIKTSIDSYNSRNDGPYLTIVRSAKLRNVFRAAAWGAKRYAKPNAVIKALVHDPRGFKMPDHFCPSGK
jgi:hypothetical protein